MDDPGRIGLHHWPNFETSHLKDYLRDHPAVKLMEVVAERDAAYAERDTAIAEKKTANAERDAALLQRDVAYADRNTALLERDTAIAALTMVRSDKDNTEAAAKLMQMVNIAVNCPAMESTLQGLPKTGNELDNPVEAKQPQKPVKQQGRKAQKDSSKKRKPAVPTSQDEKSSKSPSKRKRKQQTQHEALVKVEKIRQDEGVKNNSVALVPYDGTPPPTPYCSCTGSNQQCYRWGNGGWQSACCTNFLSIYPLPMNPVKRGSRVPGRKMSGGAFRKLLERLVGDGMDITIPIDLKNHWAKHGTNRYVTIK